MTQSTTGLVEQLRAYVAAIVCAPESPADLRVGRAMTANAMAEAADLLSTQETTIAELVAELEGMFSWDVRAVMAEMKGDWSIPANQLAADATATSGRNILPARVLKILRALHEFGLAEFGPLYNEDEPKIQGRGYWLSNTGVRAQTALTKSRSAL